MESALTTFSYTSSAILMPSSTKGSVSAFTFLTYSSSLIEFMLIMTLSCAPIIAALKHWTPTPTSLIASWEQLSTSASWSLIAS